MAKLIIMRGLPASGKSTMAKEMINVSGNTVRVNKDLLRTMLHFDKFTQKNEEVTRSVAVSVATAGLLSGKNVIIDDTNLNENTFNGWKGFLLGFNSLYGTDHKVEVVVVDTPVQICILRDQERQKSVGSTVIKNMALEHGLLGAPKKGYIICDIDGTIAEISHRLHFVKGLEKKDWKSFFAGIPGDSVREDVRKILIDFYNQGYDIIFVSARPEDYKTETLEWLNKNLLTFAFTLIMRRTGDKLPDTEVKKDLLDKYFKDKSLIHKVIDDRPSVIRMWKEQGLDVIDVGKCVEF